VEEQKRNMKKIFVQMKNINSKYEIIYNEKNKEWNLQREGLTILSGDKEGCKNYFNYIVSLTVY